MVGSVRVAGVQLPRPVAEDNDKQQKKHACDFKEEDAAQALEGAQESAYSACCIDGGAAGLPRLGAWWRNRGPGAAHARYRNRCGCTGFTGDGLPGQASRNAEPDAQNPANGLRSCHVYDVSSVTEICGCGIVL